MASIGTVAVIGAGTAGRAFALRCARAGFAVVLEDVMPEKLRRAQDEYGELEADGKGGSLALVTEVEHAVRQADLVVDFVPDELESKLEIFSLVDRMAPPRTVVLTPTEVLSITDLASCTYRSESCMAARGSLLGDAVQVLRSHFCTDETAATVLAFFDKLGVSASLAEDADERMLRPRV